MDPALGPPLVSFARLPLRPITEPQPYRFDRATTTTLVDEATRTKLLLARHGLRWGLPMPQGEGTVLLMRTTVGLSAVLARLQARADFRAAAGF